MKAISTHQCVGSLNASAGLKEHYPGERLVVCRNRALGLERARKRTQLLKATETKLGIIRDATRRERNPYPGKRRGGASRIGRRVERECAGYKVLKHFELTITDTGLDFKRSQQSIDQEAALDGFLHRARRARQSGSNGCVEVG